MRELCRGGGIERRNEADSSRRSERRRVVRSTKASGDKNDAQTCSEGQRRAIIQTARVTCERLLECQEGRWEEAPRGLTLDTSRHGEQPASRGRHFSLAHLEGVVHGEDGR